MRHVDIGDQKTCVEAICELMDSMSKPAMVANSEGLIIGVSKNLHAMKDPSFGISDGRVFVPDEASRRRLLDALTKIVVTKEKARIRFPLKIDGKNPLIIDISRIRLADGSAMALLTMNDLEAAQPFDVLLFSECFNLTTAEARLAGLLVAGNDLDRAAQVLGVKKETVRSQVKSLMEKCGVRRQADLLMLAARIAD